MPLHSFVPMGSARLKCVKSLREKFKPGSFLSPRQPDSDCLKCQIISFETLRHLSEEVPRFRKADPTSLALTSRLHTGLLLLSKTIASDYGHFKK